MKSLHYRVNEFLRSHNIPHSEDSERGEIVVLARLEHGLLITKIRIDPATGVAHEGTLSGLDRSRTQSDSIDSQECGGILLAG